MARRRTRTRYRHWATKFIPDEMGRRNFHGKVETIGDSCQADYLVMVACQRRRHEKQMHPYTLMSAKNTLHSAKLGIALPGFYCKFCRHSVRVVVTCTYRRSGEM